MKKIIILTVICILATAGFAKIPRVRTANALKKTEVSGIVTSEAMKATNKLKNSIKPSGLHIHPNLLRGPVIKPFGEMFNLDSIFLLGTPHFNPIRNPRISGWEKRLQQDYLDFKEKFAAGECDTVPFSLLLWSCYADRKGDSELSRQAYEKSKSEHLTVHDVLMYCSLGRDIPERRSELIRYVVEQDYVFGEEGLSQFTPDSIGKRYRKQLIELSERYTPGMVPLIDIVYRSDDSDKVNLFHTAADSILSGASSFQPHIQDHIFLTLLQEFVEAGQYEDALSYFAKEPLASLVKNNAIALLYLCDASIGLGDVDRFNYYLQCAMNVDSILAEEYYQEYYKRCYDILVEDPSDENLVDWLIEVNEYPVEIAFLLVGDIMDRHFPDQGLPDTFEWSDMSEFSMDELEIIKSIVYIGTEALGADESRSEELVRDHLILIIAIWMTTDPTEIENALRYIEILNDKIEKETDPSYDNLRILLVYARAYIAAHGMDKPKEAFKILNKVNKKIETMTLDPTVRMMYWQYLRAVSDALGKKGVVKRCDSVISAIQK